MGAIRRKKAWSDCPHHRGRPLNASSRKQIHLSVKTWKQWQWRFVKTPSIHYLVLTSNTIKFVRMHLLEFPLHSAYSRGDAVVKWYCSKCFCSPCGLWFLISVSRQWCKLTRLQGTIYLSLQRSSGDLLKGSNWGQLRKQWHGADNDTMQYSCLNTSVLSSRISHVWEYCGSDMKNKYSP